MKRYFELKERSTRKFWEITLNDVVATEREGLVGAEGA
jgi:hypothetical protein